MCFRPPELKAPWRCTECKSMNPFTSQKCRKCGADRPAREIKKIKCPLCGYENDSDANICHNCLTPASEIERMLKEKGELPLAPGAPSGTESIPKAPSGPKS